MNYELSSSVLHRWEGQHGVNKVFELKRDYCINACVSGIWG